MKKRDPATIIAIAVLATSCPSCLVPTTPANVANLLLISRVRVSKTYSQGIKVYDKDNVWIRSGTSVKMSSQLAELNGNYILVPEITNDIDRFAHTSDNNIAWIELVLPYTYLR